LAQATDHSECSLKFSLFEPFFAHTMVDVEEEEVVEEVEGEATGEKKKKKKNKKKKTGGGENGAEAGEATNGKTVEEDDEEAKKKKAKNGEAVADGEEDDDGEEGEEGEGEAAAGGKKKKKKKKKGGGGGGAGGNVKLFKIPAQDNSCFVLLGDWKEREDSRQNETFSIPVAEQYPGQDFPMGELQEYIGDNAFRTTSAEKREMERLMSYEYEKVRKAAECHRQVRRYVQSYMRPGLTMTDIVQRLEKKTHELVQASGLDCGWGFPTGCSLNWVAAHWTPNYGDKTVLTKDDVCKLDFGVQVGGRIVDCAFTVAFDPKYESIVKSTQDGTNTGIKTAGVDARLGEIGEAIEEVISSYEYTDAAGKTTAIKPIRNLNGHSMNPYQIHGGKTVPIVKSHDQTKMEEGEFYAIETFASNGKGWVVEDLECSHYMKVFDAPHTPLRVKSAKTLLNAIDENFGTLAFCRRWLDDIGQTRHILALKSLVDNDLVQPYPPLCEQRGSYVSQMEHTILIKSTCKEVVSRGDDY